MPLCETCGSISVVRAKPNFLDKVIRTLNGRQPVICRRCGWRARRPWDEQAAAARLALAHVSRITQDPELAVLDQESARAVDRARETTSPAVPDQSFNLKPDDLSDLKPALSESSQLRRPSSRHPSKRFRDRRHARRETIGAVAVTMAVVFVVLMFVLVSSCTGGDGI
jgi:hypothetical protein